MPGRNFASRPIGNGEVSRLRVDNPKSLLPSSPAAGTTANAKSPYPDDAWRRGLLLGCLLLVALSFLSLSVAQSIFPGFETTTLLLLVAAITLIAAAIGLLIVPVDLFRRRWRSALRRVFVVAFALAFFVPAMRMGDHLHLILFYPYYKSEIRKSGGDRQTRFDWGDAAAWVTDGAIFKTLVYDPTGSLQRYVGQRRPSKIGGLYTDHLLGDFYLETEISE